MTSQFRESVCVSPFLVDSSVLPLPLYTAPHSKMPGKHTRVIEALFTVAKTWMQPTYPSTDEWISKMWSAHTMEYYAALKGRNLWHMRLNLEDITLKKINQSHTHKSNTV